MFKTIYLYLLCSLMICANAVNAQQPVHLENARLWRAPDNTRVVFELSNSFKYKVLTLQNPERIAIDITANNLKFDLNKLDFANTPIQRIRSGQGKDILRLTFDLSTKVRPNIFALKPNQQYGHRLVVDLYDLAPTKLTENNPPSIDTNLQDVLIAIGKQQQAKQNAQQSISSNANSDQASKTASNNVPDNHQNKDIDKNKNLPTIKLQPRGKNQRDIIIVIDAGHGGEDPGAIGPRGQREKHVVLNIAKELQKQINQHEGFKAELTRTGDYFIPLRKRTEIARNKKADLFISIHADAAPKRTASGASVYAVSQKGATSETARWLADSENSSDLIGGVSTQDKSINKVLLNLSMTASMSSSLNVGKKVLDKIGNFTPLHKKNVEQAGFVVLKNPDFPSILVETGFISNHNESQKLTTSEHQIKLAKSIAAGAIAFFIQAPPPNTFIAAQRAINKTPKPAQHVVAAGDNLTRIANRYEVSVTNLRNHNQLKNDDIKIGQIIKIP